MKKAWKKTVGESAGVFFLKINKDFGCTDLLCYHVS